jgi:zinc protease
VLVETSRALPLVSINVGVRIGSLLDPIGKEGTTRMLCRLMRRTGGGLESQVLDTRIDALGGSLSAEVAPSAVVFHGTVISRSLDAFVDLMLDVLGRPGLADDELARLQRETEAELVEALDDDRGLARRWFRRKLFEGHPYARSVTGTSKSIASITSADVRELYGKLFCPEDLVFAFSGDIDESGARSIRDRLVAALPRGSKTADTTPEPEVHRGRRLVIVDKPERTQTQILIGGLGTHPTDADHTALLVGNTIFGGTFTARMTQEVRSKRGWSYGAYSSLPFDRRRQAFSMWTFPKAEDCAPCIKLELEMLKAWREDGVTKEELDWAKRYLVRSHAFAIDTAAKRVGLRFDQDLYALPDRYYEEYTARVQAVTLDEVNAAVRARIPEENLLITVVGTEASIGSAVREAVGDVVSAQVIPYDKND